MCEIPIEHITNSSVQQPTGETLCLNTSPGWKDPLSLHEGQNTPQQQGKGTQASAVGLQVHIP